jgi:uncharacterized protein DUF6916
MLDKVTKETFEPITGGVFELVLGEGQTLPLELSAVHFRGPVAPSLPQRIYRLQHPDLGVLDLFLVPIRRDATGTIYEAVFT